MCDKILEIKINDMTLGEDDPKVVNMKEIACEVLKFLTENIGRIGLSQVHLAIKKKFIIRRLLNNVMWRAEIFDKQDKGVVLVHTPNLNKAAREIGYSGYEWKDFIVPSFKHFFKVDDSMFPTEDIFRDDFIEGVADSSLLLPLVFAQTCNLC